MTNEELCGLIRDGDAGQEFSVEDLYSAVWGAGEPGSTVRSHISNLRRKLHNVKGDDYFEIVLTYNRGYTLLQTRYN